MILAQMFETMRVHGGVQTPLEKWELERDMGLDVDTTPPLPGTQPTWAPTPSNYALRTWISAAWDRIIRECGVDNVQGVTDKDYSSTDTVGPIRIDLSSVEGFRDRSIVRVRRVFWRNSQTAGDWFQRLTPANLDQLDGLNDEYMNAGPATPTRYAIEGYSLSLLPGNDTDGTLRAQYSSLPLAPEAMSDTFDELPDAYHTAVLYNALVDGALSLPADSEWRARAQGYAGFAAEGFAAIQKWFDNGMTPEFEPGTTYNVPIVRRLGRN